MSTQQCPPISRKEELRLQTRMNLHQLIVELQDTGRNREETLVLLDCAQFGANVGSIVRQATALEGTTAVLLSSSRGPEHAMTEKMLRTASRISMVERHLTVKEKNTRLVVLPTGDIDDTLTLFVEMGFSLIALENKEACEDNSPNSASRTCALWNAPLQGEKVLFIAGGESVGLSMELLAKCNFKCFIPAVECPLARAKEAREIMFQDGINPSLNMAQAVGIALYERKRQLAARSRDQD